MLIKICGITTETDARECLASGADWIGLNLVGGPRLLDIGRLAQIARALADAACAVALVNHHDLLASAGLGPTLKGLGIRRVQLYGQPIVDDARRIRDLGFEIIYVHHVVDPGSLGELAARMQELRRLVSHVLLDAHVAGTPGGTGVKVDWVTTAAALDQTGSLAGIPVILAGGLTPENVADAVRRVHPCGVDVSSGVEASPGRKDLAKVRRFVTAARPANPQDRTAGGFTG